MALLLKPDRIRRYKDVVVLLIKYGRSDLVQQADLDIAPSERQRALTPTAEPKAEELANFLLRQAPGACRFEGRKDRAASQAGGKETQAT